MRGIVTAILLVGCGRVDFVDRDKGSDASISDSVDAVGPTVVYVISAAGTTENLLTLDPATGELTMVAAFSGVGTIGGLAYWDANTLYATSFDPNEILELTLSPSALVSIGTYTGNIASLERDGNVLIGTDDTTNDLVTIDPTNGTLTRMVLHDASDTTRASQGGDVVAMPDGTWYWYSNSGTQLYVLEPATALATAVGGPATGAPFVSGMFRDDSGHLFVTSSGSQQQIEIDTTTGQLGAAITLCLACPTVYPLGSGD